MRHRLLFIILISCNLFGCVSVSLPEATVKRASGVKFQAPTENFEPIPANGGDAAWKNQKTGSVISYLSDCSGESTTPQIIRDELLHGLNQTRIRQERDFQVNNQKALRSSISQMQDGKETQIDLVIFTKGSCSYVLTFVGNAKQLAPDTPEFEKFLTGFKAP